MSVVHESYRKTALRLLDKIKEEESLKSKKYTLVSALDMYKKRKIKHISECNGDKQLKLLYKTLRRFDDTAFARSIQQKQFHDYFVAASIQNIYKGDYVKNYPRIIKENRQFANDLNQNVIITCPRRFGKTIATAMFITAYLLSIEQAEVAVFSPSKRQSVMILDTVDKFLHLLGGAHKTLVRNQEKLFISGNNPNDIRKSCYYPAVINSLRGVSGKTLILEEMAAIPQQVFYEVILPLMQLSDAYMLGISTIKDESNFMSKYIRQKDQFGESFFRIFQFYGACQSCRDGGIAFSCTHNDFLKPSWHSSSKTKRIKLLMAGNEDLANQELVGISVDKNKRAFPPKDIKNLFFKDTMTMPGYLEYIFISIDPCGTGASNFAVCSTYQKSGQCVILGMDATPCKTIEKAYSTLKAHVNKLHKINRVTKEATMVFILENNLGFEAQHIANFINKNFTKFIIMNQKDDNIGLHTDNKFKIGSALMLKNRIKQDMVSFCDNFFSTCKTIAKTKDQLEEQMSEYRQIVAESNTCFGRTRMTYTGKVDALSQDDLVITLLLNIYWTDKFHTDVNYSRFHN